MIKCQFFHDIGFNGSWTLEASVNGFIKRGISRAAFKQNNSQ